MFARLILVLFAFLTPTCVIFSAAPASAQGFMVEPMRMEISATPGAALEVPLRIRNTAADGPRELDLALAELSQHANGGWSFRSTGTIANTEPQQSSLAWTTISETAVEIAPLEPAEVMVRFEPPRNARGAYFAAILVETPAPPEGTTGVSVRMRFLIPVIIEIEGRPVRQNVKLDDLVMSYEESDSRAPTTKAHLHISNPGETFSRVTSELSIERRSGDRWRLVTKFETRERPIIPGVTLELGQDLERRLPSGEYRLRGELWVDGRRLPPLTREIEFEGDPTMDAVAYDTELRLTPDMVRMDVVPGATRATILSIENPGQDPVDVAISELTPRSLVGVKMGDLIGIELSADGWTEVRPDTFTLRGGARQNVRVLSTLPAAAGQHANYYADLTVSGSYADGQSAGERTSTVHLFNDRMESAPDGVVERVSLAEVEGSSHVVQAEFVNTGNIHVEPLARVVLQTPQGITLRSVSLTSEQGILLPLGKRSFGGEIDFEEIDPGFYALRAIVELDEGRRVSRQHVIEVEHDTVEGEQIARVTVLEGQELPEPEIENGVAGEL